MGNKIDGKLTLQEQVQVLLDNIDKWKEPSFKNLWQGKSTEQITEVANDLVERLIQGGNINNVRLANAFIRQYNETKYFPDEKLNYSLVVDDKKNVFAINGDDAVLIYNNDKRAITEKWYDKFLRSDTVSKDDEIAIHKIIEKDGKITPVEKQLAEFLVAGKKIDLEAVTNVVKTATRDGDGINASEKEVLDLVLKINPNLGVSNIPSKGMVTAYEKKDPEITTYRDHQGNELGNSGKYADLMAKYSEADGANKIDYTTQQPQLEAKAAKKQQQLQAGEPVTTKGRQ